MSVSLGSLSDRELLSRTSRLTGRERAVTLLVLLHLNEIERRRLHLKAGHPSLYAYCTNELGYSHSAANRRIRSARCVASFPEVHALLQSNAVNLSTLCQVSGVLTPDNKSTLLAQIRGKSQREVEAIVAGFEPKAAIPRDRVRSIVVKVPVATSPTSRTETGALETAMAAAETRQDRSGPARTPEPPGPAPMPAATRLEQRAMVQFCAGEDFMVLYHKLRSLVWHRLPVNPSMEQVLSFALEYVIEREDPEKRSRRSSRQRERGAGTASANRNPRYVPAHVRDEVHTRDQGRCTYVGPSGLRCGSTQALQVDHVVPVARGGPGTAANLRLLCAHHNRIEAERVFGRTRHRYDRSGRASGATTDSSPTPRAPGSCRGRPSPAPPGSRARSPGG